MQYNTILLSGVGIKHFLYVLFVCYMPCRAETTYQINFDYRILK